MNAKQKTEHNIKRKLVKRDCVPVCYIENLLSIFRVLAPARFIVCLLLVAKYAVVVVVPLSVSHEFPTQSTKLARNLLANINEPVIWPWIEMSVPSSK